MSALQHLDPAERLLRYLEKDAQVGPETLSVIDDEDFNAIVNMDASELDNDLKDIDHRLEKKIDHVKEMVGLAASEVIGQRLPADNRARSAVVQIRPSRWQLPTVRGWAGTMAASIVMAAVLSTGTHLTNRKDDTKLELAISSLNEKIASLEQRKTDDFAGKFSLMSANDTLALPPIIYFDVTTDATVGGNPAVASSGPAPAVASSGPVPAVASSWPAPAVASSGPVPAVTSSWPASSWPAPAVASSGPVPAVTSSWPSSWPAPAVASWGPAPAVASSGRPGGDVWKISMARHNLCIHSSDKCDRGKYVASDTGSVLPWSLRPRTLSLVAAVKDGEY
jgi:hypothetical protein